MAQGLPRTRFNTHRLVRVLAGLAVADVPAPRQPFAGRLGEWLDFTDALALFSALNAAPGGGPEVRPALSQEGAAAREAFARVRGALAASMTLEGVLKGFQARLEGPAAAPHGTAGSAADFAPCHRHYVGRQREMAAGIGPLRATVRAALSRHSPALRRLAALDAVLDHALASRERDLLATVPALLARRFEQLRKAHQAPLAAGQGADDPVRWLAVFCGEMQAVLLAELDLRMQPVAGLIAALDNEVAGQQ